MREVGEKSAGRRGRGVRRCVAKKSVAGVDEDGAVAGLLAVSRFVRADMGNCAIALGREKIGEQRNEGRRGKVGNLTKVARPE